MDAEHTHGARASFDLGNRPTVHRSEPSTRFNLVWDIMYGQWPYISNVMPPPKKKKIKTT